MEFLDEKIAALVNEAEKAQKEQDICAGPIRVGNRYFEFAESTFYDGKLSLYIPKEFTDMPEEVRKLKYPYEQRPQIIKSDETGSINITLSQIDQILEDYWVKELTVGMKSMIKKANPANVFYTEGVEVVNEKPIGFFDFKSSALDGFIYYVMFFFELEGKTIMGTCCCPYSDYTDWREIAFQIIHTVRVFHNEEGEDQG